MLFKIPGEQAMKMERCALALRNGMRAIGIVHKVEGLVQCDQSIHQQFCDLEMAVVVARPVHDQQVAAETLGEVDRRAVVYPSTLSWGNPM